MKLASRASRPGLTVGFLRILCNGLCTAGRFHVEGEEQMYQVGCPDEPGSVPYYNECPLLYNLFASFWGQATVLPWRGHLFHDLITQVFPGSLQYGIVVLGLIDAFVYAHNHHRRNIENPGNFGGLHEGRIRFMTAITPAFVTCLTRHMPAVQSQKFRLPSAKAKYQNLSNGRTATRERGNDFQGWAIYTDGGTRIADGETLAGWRAVARSRHGRIDVMFRPVITTEARLAFAGARTHSNSTAEMSAIGPHGPVAGDSYFLCSVTPSTLLVFAWVRFWLARTYSLRSPAHSHC